MKRLTAESAKKSGREFGKISHSNPGALFDVILDKVKSYESMIAITSDALTYINNLAKDVLAYCIIETISNPANKRMKTGDVNAVDWLINVSRFCGQSITHTIAPIFLKMAPIKILFEVCFASQHPQVLGAKHVSHPE